MFFYECIVVSCRSLFSFDVQTAYLYPWRWCGFAHAGDSLLQAARRARNEAPKQPLSGHTEVQQELLLIDDLLYVFLGQEGQYIAIREAPGPGGAMHLVYVVATPCSHYLKEQLNRFVGQWISFFRHIGQVTPKTVWGSYTITLLFSDRRTSDILLCIENIINGAGVPSPRVWFVFMIQPHSVFRMKLSNQDRIVLVFIIQACDVLRMKLSNQNCIKPRGFFTSHHLLRSVLSSDPAATCLYTCPRWYVCWFGPRWSSVGLAHDDTCAGLVHPHLDRLTCQRTSY